MKELFGSKTASNVLFYLVNYDQGYAKEIARLFKISLAMVQNQLKKFELGGILVSKLQGKTRVYFWNPRYPFLKELKALLKKGLDSMPEKEFNRYYVKRTRPRRTGKPL